MDDKELKNGIYEPALVSDIVSDEKINIYDQHDVSDMARLGKKQVFTRNFGFLSTLGFISIYMATWEFVLVSLATGLSNGGFAGLFWTFIGTVICYSTIVLSLAEMASMAPTTGGQYHWISEFAPPSSQKMLSYCAGWMSTLGWLASTASSVFVCTTLIQSLIAIGNDSFAFPNWQYTLIMLAYMLITILFNTWGANFLPMIETISLFGHLLGFLVFIIPIWIMAPKNSASEVFTSFSSSSGWDIGAGCLVTQVAVLYCNLGKLYRIENDSQLMTFYRLRLNCPHRRRNQQRQFDTATSYVVVLSHEHPSRHHSTNHHALLHRHTRRRN